MSSSRHRSVDIPASLHGDSALVIFKGAVMYSVCIFFVFSDQSLIGSSGRGFKLRRNPFSTIQLLLNLIQFDNIKLSLARCPSPRFARLRAARRCAYSPRAYPLHATKLDWELQQGDLRLCVSFGLIRANETWLLVCGCETITSVVSGDKKARAARRIPQKC